MDAPLAAVGVAGGLIFALAGFILGWLWATRSQPRMEHPRQQPVERDPEEETLWEPIPVEIVVTDWGPDFTGENDTLGRWRWAVVHAYALDGGEVGSRELPYMLGNETDQRDAMDAASAWVDARPEFNVVAFRVEVDE